MRRALANALIALAAIPLILLTVAVLFVGDAVERCGR